MARIHIIVEPEDFATLAEYVDAPEIGETTHGTAAAGKTLLRHYRVDDRSIAVVLDAAGAVTPSSISGGEWLDPVVIE